MSRATWFRHAIYRHGVVPGAPINLPHSKLEDLTGELNEFGHEGIPLEGVFPITGLGDNEDEQFHEADGNEVRTYFYFIAAC